MGWFFWRWHCTIKSFLFFIHFPPRCWDFTLIYINFILNSLKGLVSDVFVNKKCWTRGQSLSSFCFWFNCKSASCVRLCSRSVGGFWCSSEADAGGCPGEAGLQDSHLHPDWYHGLQPSSRGSGLPWEARDDGGKFCVLHRMWFLQRVLDPF